MENFSTGIKYDVRGGTYFSRYLTRIRKNIYCLIKICINGFIGQKMENPQVIPAVEIERDIKLGDASFEIKNPNSKLSLFSHKNCKIKFISPGKLCKNINDLYEDDWIVLALSPGLVKYKNNVIESKKYARSME